MRFLQCSLMLSALFAVFVPLPQAQSATDTQLDGLAGPGKSVSSAITESGVKWQQPSGPALVVPIWCKDCEYDADGTKIRSGQMVEGRFYGEAIRLVRDGDGRVRDRYSYGSPTGDLQRHEVMGEVRQD